MAGNLPILNWCLLLQYVSSPQYFSHFSWNQCFCSTVSNILTCCEIGFFLLLAFVMLKHVLKIIHKIARKESNTSNPSSEVSCWMALLRIIFPARTRQMVIQASSPLWCYMRVIVVLPILQSNLSVVKFNI